MSRNTVRHLKTQAEAIQPILCSTVSPAVLASITAHRNMVLSSDDSQLIAGYLECATDAECLCALSQMSLSAPLNDTFYNIFVYLATKELSSVGIELPESFDNEKLELSAVEQGELETFRRSLRKSQQRARVKGTFQ